MLPPRPARKSNLLPAQLALAFHRATREAAFDALQRYRTLATLIWGTTAAGADQTRAWPWLPGRCCWKTWEQRQTRCKQR
eukprot:gene9197-biopygen18188